MKPNEITIDISTLRNYLRIVGGDLIWQNRTDSQSKVNGRIAGGVHPDGYLRIKIKGSSHPAHRIMWMHIHGAIPADKQVDHIDGDKLNNHIDNLRLVTAQGNCFNRSRLTSKGYTWHKKLHKWQAMASIGGKNKYLGVFNTEGEARFAYEEAIKGTRQIGVIL
jgi:hypothetical protein